MDALRLFFEGLLALSTLSFFVCADLADDTEKGILPGRSTTKVPQSNLTKRCRLNLYDKGSKLCYKKPPDTPRSPWSGRGFVGLGSGTIDLFTQDRRRTIYDATGVLCSSETWAGASTRELALT